MTEIQHCTTRSLKLAVSFIFFFMSRSRCGLTTSGSSGQGSLRELMLDPVTVVSVAEAQQQQ